MRTWHKSREIIARLVVTGELRLESPAQLGNGDRGAHVDLPLLRDAREGRPLLQGTSLAGALRSYLRAHELGFREREPRAEARREGTPTRLAELLFGGVKGDPEGDQSPLIIDDALAADTPGEIRDGVRIDEATRTALANFKYDLEVLPPGTVFPLRFELLLPDDEAYIERLRGALALVLDGLAKGEIPMGARKSRGYGRCTVAAWKVITYQLRASRADLLAWLTTDHPGWGYQPASAGAATLGDPAPVNDQRRMFRVEADFAIATPLLIRSEEPLTEGDYQPDVSHLRDGAGEPVISGTSLAGALRARATRILAAVYPGDRQALLDELFGRDMHRRSGDPTASRLTVCEARITGGHPLVQNRVSIDRFTGGAFDTALFSEAPQIGGATRLTLTVSDPTDVHKGLLLLLLKDLWTGDLALGGTVSVGRGRLRGLRATIYDEGYAWELSEQEGRLNFADEARSVLEGYVAALRSVKEASRGA
jgi:CRISPR/Cas system CSM-associated protein Csm3 (group 7 of RAMP superfamily)